MENLGSPVLGHTEIMADCAIAVVLAHPAIPATASAEVAALIKRVYRLAEAEAQGNQDFLTQEILISSRVLSIVKEKNNV